MRIVLDASASLNAVLKGDFSDMILDLIESSRFIYAPTLYYAEISNALLRAVRTEYQSYEDAQVLYESAVGFIDAFTSIEELSYQTFHEAHRLNHSIYDIYYLELAKQKGAHLVTLDQKLISLARENELRLYTI